MQAEQLIKQKEETKSYSSTEIFQGQNVVFIEHKGGQYSLRITRNGKLILTK